MEKLIYENPSSVTESEGGWLPIEWAEKTGNLVTLMRFVRLAKIGYLNFRGVLKMYRRRYGQNYFGGGGWDSTTNQVWEQAMEGKRHRGLSKNESDIALTPELCEDLRFFISKANIKSQTELLKLVHEDAV